MMSWSHILAFVVGVSITVGGYEMNRMFSQPDSRTTMAQARGNASQAKKPSKSAAGAASKKKASSKRKKAAANNAKKANAPAANKTGGDADGRARRAEARKEAIEEPVEGVKAAPEEAKAAE
jgi:hypothetical protein